MDQDLNTWDSYTGFCYKHQFPPTLNENVKVKVYFLASQTQWPWRDHVERVLTSSKALAHKVVQHPVSHPEIPCLIKVIERLGMDGTPPFDEMTTFRAVGFASFPLSFTQGLTLTQVGV